VEADSVKAGSLEVTGNARFNGNVTLVTTASESLVVTAGGIRNEGGLIQKGNSSFGLQQTPKSTVQVTGNGISSVNYYKGLRLSNPDAATVGVQALSPALVFRGAGWKTDATAGSDSVLWSIYNLPVQGAAAPTSRLMIDAKVGSASWANKALLTSGGSFSTSCVTATAYLTTPGVNNATGYYISADADNSGSDGVIQFGKANYGAPTAANEYARFAHGGNFGIGTTTPYSHLSVVDAASGQGTGFHITSSQWNKNRTTWATSHDTSSIAGYIDSAGAPRLSMKAVDGDSLGITLDGASTVYRTSSATHTFYTGSTLSFSLGTVANGSITFVPNSTDTYNNGSSTRLWQNYWGSDNIYLGGKGQTATQYISQENTIAGQDSSMKLWIDGGNPKIDMKSGYAGQNIRQQYFGPDTLALFNGARTGRDSSWAVLPNGNVRNNGMATIKRAVSLTDAGEYTPQIPAGMCGWGSVQIGDDVEWARFRFKADGTVTLEANSTNVGTTNDVDAKLNIYDAGTSGIIIENQLGSTLTAAMVIECYTP
jgi:hypothetical protein